MNRLTLRETAILDMLAENGASNKEIARKLKLSEATIKVAVKTIRLKLRVNNRTAAAITWLRQTTPALRTPAVPSHTQSV